MHTTLCVLLGIRYPILCAPMGWITGPELAAAVSNAGGLGIMGAGALPAEELRARIRRIRQLTDKPFGVNLILTRPAEERASVCFEERVPLLSLTAGDAAPYVERAHRHGMKVCLQIGAVQTAREARDAGVDFVIAQGMEAGGHAAAQLSTFALVPQAVDAIEPTPVVAAGGVADARGMVAALALGAQGVLLGTRFIATPEASAHTHYKYLVTRASSEDTVRTTLFGGGWPNALHRVLVTDFVQEWLPDQARGSENRADEPILAQARVGDDMISIRRFAAYPPNSETTGEIDSMALYAGQSAGLVNDIKPAAQIVEQLVREAQQLLSERLATLAK